MERIYSLEWFETFSATIPTSVIEGEVDRLVGLLPLNEYRRVLDVGCGVGRIAGPMHARGYLVTAIDVNVEALRTARIRAPGPSYVALDQHQVGRLRWRFDAALVLWNSIGFAGRSGDRQTLLGLWTVLRPDGALVLDLYHPGWLRRNEAQRTSERDGVSVRRWVSGHRCFNEIQYGSGAIDRIDFDVYLPEEIRELAREADFEPGAAMVWWNPEICPGPQHARYQLICRRLS